MTSIWYVGGADVRRLNPPDIMNVTDGGFDDGPFTWDESNGWSLTRGLDINDEIATAIAAAFPDEFQLSGITASRPGVVVTEPDLVNNGTGWRKVLHGSVPVRYKRTGDGKIQCTVNPQFEWDGVLDSMAGASVPAIFAPVPYNLLTVQMFTDDGSYVGDVLIYNGEWNMINWSGGTFVSGYIEWTTEAPLDGALPGVSD